MIEPLSSTVRAYASHMLRMYEGTLRAKGDALEMRAAGAILGGLGVLDAKAFASRYVTTIGSTVYVPFTVGDATDIWSLWSQIEVIAHECQHLAQKRERGLAYEYDYLTSTARRAHTEAEAFAANAALHHWRFGEIESWWPAMRSDSLRSYGCSAGDLAVSERHLKSVAASARRGLVVSAAARTAIRWLDAHAPELRHSTVVGS